MSKGEMMGNDGEQGEQRGARGVRGNDREQWGNGGE